jgi:hypothetical protein
MPDCVGVASNCTEASLGDQVGPPGSLREMDSCVAVSAEKSWSTTGPPDGPQYAVSSPFRDVKVTLCAEAIPVAPSATSAHRTDQRSERGGCAG